jgi:AcrR family transcriptional regulator
VPKLWNATLEAHRREVHTAIIDTTAALVFERGLRAVTMSQIAEETGIGRATLYKYFPDVEAILQAWHSRQVSAHLEHLTGVRDGADTPAQQLSAVLTAYAQIVRQSLSHETELVKVLHPGNQIADARQQLLNMLQEVIADGARSGELRDDMTPPELAAYSLHALAAAGDATSAAAINRLVAVIIDGLRRHEVAARTPRKSGQARAATPRADRTSQRRR